MVALEKLLSMQEAADTLGVTKTGLLRAVKTGRLTYIDLGTGAHAIMKFRRADVEAARIALAEPSVPTVYVVGFSPFVKIGYTTDLPGRLLDLQEHLPMPLQLYHSFPGRVADERRLHARFAEYRTRGEWFKRTGNLAEWIREGCPIGEGNDA